MQGLPKISNSPVSLCISLLKSQLCLEGRQLWLAGTYSPPVPQELSLSSHLGLWSQPSHVQGMSDLSPFAANHRCPPSHSQLQELSTKAAKGGGYGRFSLAKKSQEK